MGLSERGPGTARTNRAPHRTTTLQPRHRFAVRRIGPQANQGRGAAAGPHARARTPGAEPSRRSETRPRADVRCPSGPASRSEPRGAGSRTAAPTFRSRSVPRKARRSRRPHERRPASGPQASTHDLFRSAQRAADRQVAAASPGSLVTTPAPNQSRCGAAGAQACPFTAGSRLAGRARDGRRGGRCRDRPRSRAQRAPRARRVERPAAPLPQRVLGASPCRARRSRPSGVARPRRKKAPATPYVQRRHRPGSTAPRSEARPRASPRPAWPDDQALPYQRCRGRRSRRSRDQRETSAVADADGPFTHPGVQCLRSARFP